MLQKFRLHSQLWLFALLILCLVFKSAVWHMQFFGDKSIPWLGCLCMAMLLAAGVLLSKKRPWWIMILLFLTNIWLFANYVYERAWGQMLSMDIIKMATNLRGFEDSILTYCHRDMLYWLLLPDVVCVAALYFWQQQEKRSWRIFGLIISVNILLIPAQQLEYYEQVYERRVGYNNNTGFAHWWHIYKPLFNLMEWPQDAACDAFMFQVPQDWARPFVKQYGILHFGHALCAFDAQYNSLEHSAKGEAVELNSEQKELMKHLTGPRTNFSPDRSLVFILVESLESWAVDYPLGEGFVMPNLHNFICSHNVYYAPHMYCQVGYGGSSDGQLMAMTGLLPVRKGVSVALYGDQSFPNYAHYFPHSITLNPSPGVWKQHLVNPNYGIQVLEESDSIRDDAGIFKRLNTIDFSEPTFVLAITISSHVPYTKADEIDLPLDPEMPQTMAKYLKCMHYMDEHMGTFLKRLEEDPALAHTDVVITGDHTIFYSHDWQAMRNYAASKGITCLDSENNTTALMLWSKQFISPIRDEDDTYQMDIYPTVLHMIGCTSSEWHGLGRDLLSDSLRFLDIQQAVDLSDKLIRGKYFETQIYP